MLVNIEKLEQILISNWAEFLDLRKIIGFLQTLATEHLSEDRLQVLKVTISRFELSEGGFLLWFDYDVNLTNQKKKVNMTSEVRLLNNGTLLHLQTI
jgi:hypothetical protein